MGGEDRARRYRGFRVPLDNVRQVIRPPNPALSVFILLVQVRVCPALQKLDAGHAFSAGFRIFLAANSLVLCYYMGPRRSTTVAASCALACAAGRFAHVLATTEKVRYPGAHGRLTI